MEPKVLNVNTLVSGLTDLLRRTLGENISIEFVQGAGLGRVFADGHQLENAILNLAVNARDAMPGGGRLTIETENVSLDQRYSADNGISAGAYVRVSVSDTGSGMSPEVMARAFDPLLHHQSRWPRHRSRTQPSLRFRQTIGRAHQDLLRAGPRHLREDLFTAPRTDHRRRLTSSGGGIADGNTSPRRGLGRRG